MKTTENSSHGGGTRNTRIPSPVSATDVACPQASHFTLLCLQIFFLRLQILGCKLLHCFSYAFYRTYCRHGASNSEALDVPAVILDVPSSAPTTSQHMPDKPSARPGRGTAISISRDMHISAVLTKSNRPPTLNFPIPVSSASPSLRSRDLLVLEPVQPQLFDCRSKTFHRHKAMLHVF